MSEWPSGAMPSLQVSYAGYLPSRNLWLASGDKVVASYPYLGVVPFATLAPGPPPAGTVTCLANAATYGGFDIAPGEIASLFGNQIGPPAPATAALDAAGNAASQLAGMQILVGGMPAPLLYAGPNQINLVTPCLVDGQSGAVRTAPQRGPAGEFPGECGGPASGAVHARQFGCGPTGGAQPGWGGEPRCQSGQRGYRSGPLRDRAGRDDAGAERR